MSEPLPLTAFTTWLASGERGMSSEAIVTHLTGQKVGRYASSPPAHPYDPADLVRCEKLLRAAPLARLHFGRMASASSIWAALVAEWDSLVECLEHEIPDVFNGRHGSAPLTYARMQQLRGVA